MNSGQWEKIPQSGPVRIGDRVDVQANACVDRATVGATEIGDGSKIDNLVQIGHGSRVGKDTLVCAQTGTRRIIGHRQQRHSCRTDRHRRTLHASATA